MIYYLFITYGGSMYINGAIVLILYHFCARSRGTIYNYRNIYVPGKYTVKTEVKTYSTLRHLPFPRSSIRYFSPPDSTYTYIIHVAYLYISYDYKIYRAITYILWYTFRILCCGGDRLEIHKIIVSRIVYTVACLRIFNGGGECYN